MVVVSDHQPSWWWPTISPPSALAVQHGTYPSHHPLVPSPTPLPSQDDTKLLVDAFFGTSRFRILYLVENEDKREEHGFFADGIYCIRLLADTEVRKDGAAQQLFAYLGNDVLGIETLAARSLYPPPPPTPACLFTLPKLRPRLQPARSLPRCTPFAYSVAHAYARP